MTDDIIITWSMISTWRTCKRKFWYEYRKLYASISPNLHFFNGELLHLMVNSFHAEDDPDYVRSFIYEKGQKLLKKFRKKFRITAEEETDLIEAVEFIPIISDGYYNHYQGKFPRVIEFEKVLEMPIVPGVVLKGKIDEITVKKKINQVYEIKSTKYITADYVGKYAADGQTMTYVILADYNDYNPQEVVLDCIRKPGIRQGKKETDASFYNRLYELYDSQAKEYFYTNIYSLNIRMIKAHLVSLQSDAVQISDLPDNEKYYPINAASCYNYGKCQFLPLCQHGENELTLINYRIKTSQNEELEEGEGE